MEGLSTLSGLSGPKAAQHLLQGSIKQLSENIWDKVDQVAAKDIANLLPLLERAAHSINAVPWYTDSTILALNETSVAVEVLRMIAIFMIYSPPGDSSTRLLSEEIVELTTSSCFSALEVVRNDKLLDDLMNMFPTLLRLFCNQIGSDGEEGNIAAKASFLLRLVTTTTRLCESYSNHKKLFILGCEVLLPHCLQTVFLLHLHRIEKFMALEEALGSLLGRCIFDSSQAIEEITRISLDTVASVSTDKAVAPRFEEAVSSRKRKHDVAGASTADEYSPATGGRKKRAAAGVSSRAAPSHVSSYHAGFYSAVSLWVAQTASVTAVDSRKSPEDAGRAVNAALSILFAVFLKASRSIARAAGLEGSGVTTFTVRWRQHVKRVLHLGLGLVLSIMRYRAAITTPIQSIEWFDFVLLMSHDALVNCVNSGLSGTAGGSGGTVPNHESLNTYVSRLQSAASAAVSDATSALIAMRNLFEAGEGATRNDTDEASHRVRMASGHLKLLRSLIVVDCRVMADDTLPLTLRNLSIACDVLATCECMSQQATATGKALISLGAVCKDLFMELLHLHGKLRQLDLFLTAVLDEMRSGQSDKSFSAVLLSAEDTQGALQQWFGAMPDGQRHSCWESVYAVLIAEQSDGIGSACSGITYIHTLCDLLGSLGLSTELDTPVPPLVLTEYLMQTQDIIRFELCEKPAATDLSTLSAAMRCASILLRVGSRYLSSCAFHSTIPPYTYEVKSTVKSLPVLAADDVSQRENILAELPAQQWTKFCVVAAVCVTSAFPDWANTQIYADSHSKCKHYAFLPQILELIKNCHSVESGVGHLGESCVDFLFDCYSLLSIASVDRSPIMRIFGNVSDCEESMSDSCATYCEVIVNTFAEIGSRFIYELLEVLTVNSVTARNPLLLSALLFHLPIWGHVASSDDKSGNRISNIMGAIADSIAKCLVDEQDGSSNVCKEIIHSLSLPMLIEIPLFLPAAAVLAQDELHYTAMARALFLLPPVLVSYQWQSILLSCRQALDFISTHDGIRWITSVMKRILTEVLCFEEEKSEGMNDLLLEILGCMIVPQPDSLSAGLFGIIQSTLILRDTSISLHEQKCECCSCSSLVLSVDAISTSVKLLVQRTISNCFEMDDCADSVAAQLCGALCCALFGKECGEKERVFECCLPVDDLMFYLIEQLKTCSSGIRGGLWELFFELFHTAVKVYCEKALHLPWRALNAVPDTAISSLDEAKTSESSLQSYLELFLVDLKREPDPSRRDHLYSVIADLYRLWFCAGNMRNAYNSCAGMAHILTSDLESELFSAALSGTSAVESGSSGWLDFIGAYVLFSGKCFQSGGRYLSQEVIRILMDRIVGVLRRSCPLTERSDLSCHATSAISSVLTVTPPSLRETLVARPVFGAVENLLFTKQIPVDTIFALLKVLLRAARCEWRDDNGASVTRRDFRKSVLRQACFMAERLSTSSNCLLEDKTDCSSSSGHNPSFQLILTAELFEEELLCCLAALNGPRGPGTRKTTNKTEDTANRQSQAALLGDIFEGTMLFLASSVTHVLTICQGNISNSSRHTGISSADGKLCEVVHTLIKLLSSVLSCPPLAVINSNIGSIVLIFRQVTVLSIVLASRQVDHVSNAGQISGIDVLRALGRALMAAASTKHLHKHAYLIIVSVVDALTWFTKRNTLEQVLDSSSEMWLQDTPSVLPDYNVSKRLTVSSSDETLRETLLPGLFALLDRCKTTKQQKLMFSMLDKNGRAIFSDLHNVYQQDFKFIGKA